jgi:hypothetical protein
VSIGHKEVPARVTCDCGRPVPYRDGKPIFKDSNNAICERCYELQKSWKWSRWNPNCAEELHRYRRPKVAQYLGGLPYATIGGRA